MNQQTTETSEEKNSTSLWDSDQRVKLACLGGSLGGTVLSLLSISRTGLGIEPGSIS